MANFLPSITRPIATPATGCLIGTPASIIASVAAHAVAMDELPFDSRISLVMRMVYGKSSRDGSTGSTPRSASAP